MTVKVQHVESNYIHQIWPQVEPWFIPVFTKSNLNEYYSIENLKDYMVRGEHTLLVGINESNIIQGAASIQWLNFPNARIAYVAALGGNMIISKEYHQELINWVRAMGGTKIKGVARDSVARLWKQKLGYMPAPITMELNL